MFNTDMVIELYTEALKVMNPGYTATSTSKIEEDILTSAIKINNSYLQNMGTSTTVDGTKVIYRNNGEISCVIDLAGLFLSDVDDHVASVHNYIDTLRAQINDPGVKIETVSSFDVDSILNDPFFGEDIVMTYGMADDNSLVQCY